MEIDWGQALETGGLGFLLVFIVLAALALVIWLAGYLINKAGGSADTETGSNNNNQEEEPIA